MPLGTWFSTLVTSSGHLNGLVRHKDSQYQKIYLIFYFNRDLNTSFTIISKCAIFDAGFLLGGTID